ncbi:hypothetical protein BKA70DRAFT_1283098 [Coprinopsis sp. MPI-PUGE-AT-0042]|nr:hypothetical protein BKA70DRAFT_1283098 [Coprinopsis sp. MPI-PUGE-AT-0042]
MAFTSLPPEIHSYIAQHLCQVDQTTSSIKSLALTSQYFWDVTNPWIYYTISIPYLHSKSEATTSAIFALLKRGISQTSFYHALHHLAGSNPAHLQNAVMRIVQLCAPTLQTFALDCTQYLAGSTGPISRIYRTRFPRLRSLTLAGFYSFPTPSLALASSRPSSSTFSSTFPALKSLRVSGVSMAPGFALEVEEAFRPTETVDSPPPYVNPSTDPLEAFFPSSPYSEKASLPETICHLIIQPSPSLEPAMMKDRGMMDRLRKIVPATVLTLKGMINGVKYTLMQRPETGLMTDTLRSMWVDDL